MPTMATAGTQDAVGTTGVGARPKAFHRRNKKNKRLTIEEMLMLILKFVKARNNKQGIKKGHEKTDEQ